MQMNDFEIKEGLVFRPTKEEFKNFQEYLEKCESEAGNHAIFKVWSKENFQPSLMP